ncbi:Tetratricopeptide repeat protein [Rubrivivax sp. A210]|uniref:caspase family protein n=1 Tax=Rubrivivax sp. A210 TaxID=2772301 RepID=UPI00191830FF|nr:caspase family protein [Rubrivivax sp. A210]CAD5367119.1 Tetratricopeptide repeat protein [Rubrivivax sp. A210]
MQPDALPTPAGTWLRRLAGWLLLALLSPSWAAVAPAAEPRHALVVGNANYANAPLLNSTNDASAVAKVLEKAGFKVDLRLDASQKQMQEAVTAFGDRLKAGGAGLFYFAGHGVQIKGRNFLMPVGTEIKREDEVPYKAVDVQQVLDKMETAKNRINVVVLDACRDNPFARSSRSGGGGLSSVDAPIGSLVAFATAPGSVASDGKGSNGLYTQHLLANIERPGMSIEEVFKRVRLGVRLDSNGQQIPWESTSLEGEFVFFAPQASAKGGPTTLPAPPGIEHIARAERGYELLRQGLVDDAERIFRALAGTAHPEVVWMGREGLAELQLQRGDSAGALAEANDIIAKAPTRSAAYLIRGRSLAAAGQAQAGQAALQQAAGSQTSADFSWQKSSALVAVGNAQRKQDPQAAVKTYERAARENPQSIEAASNLAVALNETGQTTKARLVLERAKALDPNDAMVAALLRQTQENLADEQDRARQQYVDEAVKDLAARFRNPPPRPAAAGAPDDWTSPVMALSVLPFQDQTPPGHVGRIGVEALLQQELIRELQARGYTLVERRLLDKVLAEVRLGSSELADQDTQIKLGKLLAARLMVSGVLSAQGAGLNASLRAIDTETTQLALVKSDSSTGAPDPTRLAATMAQAVAATVRDKYPLKGRIVSVDGSTAIINLGKKHGIAAGQSFNVLSRGEPIELNGRILGYKDSRIAQITVTEVDELLAHGRVADVKAPLERNQRIVARKE